MIIKWPPKKSLVEHVASVDVSWQFSSVFGYERPSANIAGHASIFSIKRSSVWAIALKLFDKYQKIPKSTTYKTPKITKSTKKYQKCSKNYQKISKSTTKHQNNKKVPKSTFIKKCKEPKVFGSLQQYSAEPTKR